MDLIYLLAIVGTVLASIYLLYFSLLPKPIRGIPYNESSSRRLLGDIPALTTHLSTTRSGTFTTYAASLMRTLNSPLIQVFIRPLNKPTLVLGDYAESYNVFVRRTREFDRSPTIGYMLLGFIPENHIHLRTNDKWKAQRRLLLGAMSAAFIYGVLGDVIGEGVAGLVELWRWKSRVAAGRPWSAAGDLYLLALGGIMAFTFGGHFGPGVVGVEEVEGSGEVAAEASDSVRESDRDLPVDFPERALNKVFQATLNITCTMGELRGSLMPRVKWELVRRRQRVKDAVKVMEDNAQRELAKAVRKLHLSAETTPQSAVEHMVAHERELARKEGREPDYFSRVMVDEIAGFTIAAYETTGTTLCWGLKYLTDLPQIQCKLRLALEAGYSAAMKAGRNPTIKEIISTDIPYLDATTQEILRFANPATAVDREALVDTQILGHAVPKGTIVTCILPEPALISPADIAKDSSQRPADTQPWDQPELALFNPERWILDGQFNLDAAPRVAFGLGPRACPGKRLAYLEIKAALVAVLWNFELLPCPTNLSGYEKVVLATQKPKQCYLRLREVVRS